MHRGSDRSGDPSGDAGGARGGGDGRFARGPSRWSGGGGGSPPQRFSRGGSGDGGGGGRFHPYRGPSDYSGGVECALQCLLHIRRRGGTGRREGRSSVDGLEQEAARDVDFKLRRKENPVH